MKKPIKNKTSLVPKWNVGPIPEPTGFCILILESPNGHHHIVRSFRSGLLTKKHTWGSVYGLRVDMEAMQNTIILTGRWFIQQVKLPQS